MQVRVGQGARARGRAGAHRHRHLAALGKVLAEAGAEHVRDARVRRLLLLRGAEQLQHLVQQVLLPDDRKHALVSRGPRERAQSTTVVGSGQRGRSRAAVSGYAMAAHRVLLERGPLHRTEQPHHGPRDAGACLLGRALPHKRRHQQRQHRFDGRVVPAAAATTAAAAAAAGLERLLGAEAELEATAASGAGGLGRVLGSRLLVTEGVCVGVLRVLGRGQPCQPCPRCVGARQDDGEVKVAEVGKVVALAEEAVGRGLKRPCQPPCAAAEPS